MSSIQHHTKHTKILLVRNLDYTYEAQNFPLADYSRKTANWLRTQAEEVAWSALSHLWGFGNGWPYSFPLLASPFYVGMLQRNSGLGESAYGVKRSISQLGVPRLLWFSSFSCLVFASPSFSWQVGGLLFSSLVVFGIVAGKPQPFAILVSLYREILYAFYKSRAWPFFKKKTGLIEWFGTFRFSWGYFHSRQDWDILRQRFFEYFYRS